jgi:hypothetical protein
MPFDEVVAFCSKGLTGVVGDGGEVDRLGAVKSEEGYSGYDGPEVHPRLGTPDQGAGCPCPVADRAVPRCGVDLPGAIIAVSGFKIQEGLSVAGKPKAQGL